ncbi:MAG: S41 family peptidase [Bacteroidota bacterium]|nr:S41 family peptidase [Bacteroidota bacterium]
MKNITCLLIAFTFSYSLIAQNNPEIKLELPTKNKVIDNICKALNKNYVYPDKAKLMCDYINEQNIIGKYNSITNANELANQVLKHIRSVYNDTHLRIEYDPQLEKEILKFLSSKKDAIKISEADIAKEEKMNFYFKKLEILPSNIGYIEFNGFANPSHEARKTINAAMQFVSHTDALIIDLRNNFGGSGGQSIANYFFNTKTYTGRSFNRIENKWTDNYIENQKVITNGLVLQMPVYILTSKRTFSAAEGLAYTLQKLKNAVIIGDTTRGGAHLTRSFSLGNGFVGFIPYMRGENVITKTDWEGTGVIPNIAIEESNSLVVAQNIILNKKFNATTNENEKRKINYIINYNKSKNASIIIDPLQASKFTGRFAEFEVVLQGGQLMFRDTNQPTIKYKKMIAITPTSFQVGSDYQVEFINENGLYNSIKMFWDDGYEDKSSKSN